MSLTPIYGRARHRASAFVLVIGLFASACGGGGATSPAAGSSDTPTPRPERIVSLSPTATEMLFAIGAGDQVVAVDDQSNYPPEAPTTDLSGYEPNIEAIAAYDPDLVVVSDTGPVVKAFKKLGTPVLVLPAVADIEGTYEQIEELGQETGREEEAAEVVASMRDDVEEIVSSIPEFDKAPTYYHELDDTFYTVTSKTFIGAVYSMLGLENIADKAPDAASGYPQLSVEYIVDADPDLIFLADTRCCDQSAMTVSKRAGWNQITAVRNGDVVELDDDVASRWGPRVVDFLRKVADAVAELEQAA